MFGLSLYSELLHGSALRTWNCVAHVVGALWHRVVHHLGDINNMPRSRRRHHSRSRSRSNSHDRDREPKRRKVESFESPPHTRRSVSSEPEANEIVENAQNDRPVDNIDAQSDSIPAGDATAAPLNADKSEKCEAQDPDKSGVGVVDSHNAPESGVESAAGEEVQLDASVVSAGEELKLDASEASVGEELNTSVTVAQALLKDAPASTTPQKQLTPKQVQKRLESEKKKAERQREKDERQRAKQQERDEKQRLKQLEKDAKDAKAKEERDAKQREKDLKDREREAKRREKEEKDEVKRKEREAERMKKQAEAEERNREKQKLEEKKQKAAAAFTRFFVARPAGSEPKKEVLLDEGVVSTYFMPFQLKSDMRLAPTTRLNLTRAAKESLLDALREQVASQAYLPTLKTKKRASGKTWPIEDPPDDDAVIVKSDIGEGIVDAEKRGSIMKAKYLKFHENQRPAYYGTWRKKSKTISGRRPFVRDSIFNYEVDSDDEWEEEEEGEDIAGSDDEEKEPDSENDYEVDDEFFVPHGHLSDDEESEDESITPEMRKAKEKLLKNQFDEERKTKTQKLKPRVIGCIWYNQNNNEDGSVDEAIDQLLRPFAIISKGVVTIRKRSEFEVPKKRKWQLDKELMPDLLRLVHANTHNRKFMTSEFLEYLSRKNIPITASKFGLTKLIKSIAKWGRCKQEGPLFKKMCWMVNEETQTKFNHVALSMPNAWQYCTELSKEAES